MMGQILAGFPDVPPVRRGRPVEGSTRSWLLRWRGASVSDFTCACAVGSEASSLNPGRRVRGTDGVWGRLQGLDAFPSVSTFIDGDSIRACVCECMRIAVHAEPPHVLHAHTSTKCESAGLS